MTTVGLLHPGNMGAAVAAEIRRNGHTVLWCSEGRSANTRRRADDAGLQSVGDLPTMLDQCDVVLSVCPPSAAEDVAALVAKTGYRGVFVDANAVGPTTLHRIADVVLTAGASFVDGSIIGPPPGRHRNATRFYLAGEPAHADPVAELVSGTGVEAARLGEQPGSASALKMAFASYQKASRVLAAVAHALADEHGVTDALMAEADRLSGRILSQRDYLPSVAGRAWRWGPEMHEIARTLDEAGLPPDMALAAASVLARWDNDRDLADLSTATVLEHLRTSR